MVVLAGPQRGSKDVCMAQYARLGGGQTGEDRPEGRRIGDLLERRLRELPKHVLESRGEVHSEEGTLSKRGSGAYSDRKPKSHQATAPKTCPNVAELRRNTPTQTRSGPRRAVLAI